VQRQRSEKKKNLRFLHHTRIQIRVTWAIYICPRVASLLRAIPSITLDRRLRRNGMLPEVASKGYMSEEEPTEPSADELPPPLFAPYCITWSW
jgi:hypothetical protein